MQGPIGTAPEENPFTGFRKRTYRLGELLRDLTALVPRFPGIFSIWVRRRMPSLLREEIMVAVAETNACRFCRFVHGRWALSQGLGEEGLAQIGQADRRATADADPARLLALDYAQALAEARFHTVPKELQARVEERLGRGRRQDIETVARVMTVANLCANTVDALLSRRNGVPSGHSRLVDELVIGAGFLLVYPVMMVVLAILEKRSPLAVWRDFVHSGRYPASSP